jgi:cytochrome c oxidase cbb3-type subunit 2
MGGGIYSKPVLFSVVATAVILVGTVATMFYPMFTTGMHPKLDDLKPYTALELAGKDVYMQEGCNNCHTQTVRPLRTEVMRYGEYSKAGEFTYDRPFLWGSKRTGPDLARIGGKYPDAWHIKHFENAQEFVHPKSNMPPYGWLAGRKLKPASVKKRMDVNGFPYSPEEISGLAEMTELDALVAYVQVIGTAVRRKAPSPAASGPVEENNPLGGSADAIAKGRELYGEHCAMCHGDEAEGDIGPGLDDYDADDGDFYEVLSTGVEGEMPGFGSQLDSGALWSIITFLQSLSEEEEPEADESASPEPRKEDPAAIEKGEEIYGARCAMCHGKGLEGSIGPSLVDDVFAGQEGDASDSAYFKVIFDGRAGGMPTFGAQLTEEEIRAVVSFIRSRQADR